MYYYIIKLVEYALLELIFLITYSAAILLTLWYLRDNRKYNDLLATLAVGAYVLGITMLSLYYSTFHPNKTLKKQNDSLFQGQLSKYIFSKYKRIKNSF